ncbi:10572_t:CDS:2, partial [Diversispora eburnea]
PKVPDFMLNWIPEWYLNLMYRCWSDDPSKRPTATELADLFYDLSHNLVDDDLHPQSYYIGRYIHTLHELHDLLEEIKSGKSSDPNLLLKSNESTTSS